MPIFLWFCLYPLVLYSFCKYKSNNVFYITHRIVDSKFVGLGELDVFIIFVANNIMQDGSRKWICCSWHYYINEKWDHKGRFSNIELLRIVLMIMIVLWHLLVHGKYHVFFIQLDIVRLCWFVSSFNSFFFHVNTFVFISGYFESVINQRKYFLFTSLICFVPWWGGAGGYSWNIWPASIAQCATDANWGPVSKAWFACEYFALLLYAPLLNAGIERINRFQFTLILCVLFFPFWFVPLYLWIWPFHFLILFSCICWDVTFISIVSLGLRLVVGVRCCYSWDCCCWMF